MINLKQYDKKKIRITTTNDEMFEGIAECCYDEDDSNEYVIYLPHNKLINCIEEIHADDIAKIELLIP